MVYARTEDQVHAAFFGIGLPREGVKAFEDIGKFRRLWDVKFIDADGLKFLCNVLATAYWINAVLAVGCASIKAAVHGSFVSFNGRFPGFARETYLRRCERRERERNEDKDCAGG